jgi:hypothetical protein
MTLLDSRYSASMTLYWILLGLALFWLIGKLFGKPY